MSDAHEEYGEFNHPEEVAIENIDITIEAMWRLFVEISEWSRAADFKASVVLAADGVIIVAGAALAVSGGTLGAMLLRYHYGIFFFLLTIVCVILSSTFAALCLVPPFRKSDTQSILFMNYIALQFPTAQSYENCVRTTLTNADSNLKHISYQVWLVSKIFRRKMSYVLWSIRFLIAAFACILLNLLLASL